MSKRADLELVARGLAHSRTHAQNLIESGRVWVAVNGVRSKITKSSQLVSTEDPIAVEESQQEEYVSRGGLKLKAALDQTGLEIIDFDVLDVGISTGGFTDCVLQAGAHFVLGLDVGHEQLAAKLRGESKLIWLEGINAREIPRTQLEKACAGHKFATLEFDLAVIDVSFISLTLVLPSVIQYLKRDGNLLALVKPQFEVGREKLGKNGIVKDPSCYADVERKIRSSCEQLDLHVESYFGSSIKGGDGNQEFFVYAKFRPQK